MHQQIFPNNRIKRGAWRKESRGMVGTRISIHWTGLTRPEGGA